MRLEKRKQPKRMLALLLTFVLAFTLFPFSVFAEGDENGWDDLGRHLESETRTDVLEEANSRLDGRGFAFSFTDYAVPAETAIDPDETGYVDQLAEGILSVTVTDQTARGGTEETGNEGAAAPVEVKLPVGTYTIAYKPLGDGKFVSEPNPADGGVLTIEGETPATISYSITSETPKPAKPDLNNYVTGMTLTVNDETTVDLTDEESVKALKLNIGDKILVDCSFKIGDGNDRNANTPAELGFQGGEPYSVQVPGNLTFDKNKLSCDILKRDTTDSIGTFTLNPSDGIANVTFYEDAIDEYTLEIAGSFNYGGTVQPGATGEGDELSFTILGNVIIIPVIRPVPTANVNKKGAYVDFTGNALARWTITIDSPEGSFPAGLVISDEMTFENKVIHELREIESVQIDGEKFEKYTLTPTALGFDLTLGEAVKGQTMTIVFTSNLSEDGLKRLKSISGSREVKNVVTVKESVQEGADGAGTLWGEANAKVNAKIDMLRKTYVEEKQGQQKWNLFVNEAFVKIPANTVITDTPSAGLEYVEGSAKVYLWDSEAATASKVGPGNLKSYVKADDYITLKKTAQGVTFTLNKEINVPMVILLETKRSEGVADKYEIKNHAEIEIFGKTVNAEASAGKGVLPGDYLYKEGRLFDLSNREAGWDIFVGNTPGKVTVTDELGQHMLIAADKTLQGQYQGDKYVEIVKLSEKTIAEAKGQGHGGNPEEGLNKRGSFDLTGAANMAPQTIDGVEFTVSYDKVSHTLTVTTDQKLDGIYRIRFYTQLDNALVYGTQTANPTGGALGGKDNRKVENTVKLKVEGDQTDYRWDAEQNKSGRNFDKPAGNSRYYDEDTRTITWTLLANQMELPYQNGTFKIYDKLPAGLEFVEPYKDSINITSTDGKPLEALGYNADIQVNGNLLTISIMPQSGMEEGPFKLPVKVILKTHVTDDGMKEIFKLGAHTFKNQAYQSGADLSGTTRWEGDWEELQLKGAAIKKSAAYDKDNAAVNWTVEINPNHLAAIDTSNTVQQKISDQMTVSGLKQGSSIDPTKLVSFDGTKLKLVRSAPGDNVGTVLDVKPLSSDSAPTEAGHYYHYNPDTLALTVYVDTSEAVGGGPRDKYTLTYTTAIEVPFDYKGNEVVTVKNGVAWSGYQGSDSANNIALAQVNASASLRSSSKLKITKQDSVTKALLSGATFELYQVGEGGDTLLGAYTTGKDGTVTISRLKIGEYYLVEIQAPENYVLKTDRIPVTIEQEKVTVYVEVPNEFVQGSIQITKIDSTGEQKPLAGVEFTLYTKHADGTETKYEAEGLTNPNTTNESGIVTFENLPVGGYVVRETKALENYFPLDEAIEVTVSESKTYAETVENTPIENFIQITKTDAATGKALAGAEFTLYTQGEDGLVKAEVAGNPATSDANGVAEFRNLPLGRYVVKETKAPDGYELNSKWVGEAVISKEQTEFKLTCENQPILGSLRVMKISSIPATDGGRIPLAGAQFQLLASDQTTVVTASALTNQAGLVEFKGLRLGSYYLKEIVAPEGYDLSTDLIPVTVSVTTSENNAAYVYVENHKTEIPDEPVTPDNPENPENPTPPDENIPDDDTPTGGRDDNEDRTPIRVVEPGNLTPEEVEVLIEDGYVPLDDRPDLTTEQIIEEDIPLVLIPDEDVPLAMMPGLPQTGDGTPVGLLVFLLIASLTGLAVLLRRPRHDDQT